MSRAMNIGEAAQAAGVSTKMIRHYEQLGLLAAQSRTDSGYRQYGEREVSVLRFVRHCRQLGFSMAQIGELIDLWSNDRRPSREVKSLAQRHLADLEARLRELAEMKTAMERLVSACAGNDDPHCAILQGLAAQSPSAPKGRPGPAPQAKAARKVGAKERAPRAAQAPDAAGLMAWTRFLYSPGAGR